MSWFAAPGVTVERVLSDNGSAFKSHFWRHTCRATHNFDRNAPDGDNVTASDLSRMTGVNLHEEFATVVTTAGLLEQVQQLATAR